MRQNFLGPTVTRVLHIHRFTPGPGKKELGGTVSGMSARGGKPAQETPLFLLKKKAKKKGVRARARAFLACSD